MDNIEIFLDGKKLTVESGKTLEELLPEGQYKSELPIMGAMVDNEVTELCYRPREGDQITLLSIVSKEGNRIYMRGMLHMLERACGRVFGASLVRVEHSIENNLYCTVKTKNNEPVSPFDVERVEKLMKEYAALNELFIKTVVRREDAIAMLRKFADKAAILEYSTSDKVAVYTCGGLTDCFYGAMPPSTGYISRFRLVCDNQGFIVIYPRRNHIENEFSYERHPKISYIFSQSEHWADILGCKNIADLNAMVRDGALERCVLLNEALHEKVIASFADNIRDSGKRIALISGPSSSGKTTFTQRLGIQLSVLGFKAVRISMDDYFIDRDRVPKGPDGMQDFEHINVMDIPLFNEQVKELLAGRSIELPRYDFPSGKQIFKTGKFIALGPDTILLFEGIHALNPTLLADVSADEKFRIYISAQTQLNMDNLNRVSTTDLRLLRRMVRDHHYRSIDAEKTLLTWKKVRAGEDKWIFPYEENCEVMFNSTLFYELLFIKQKAYSLLAAVSKESSAYPDARRLLDLLDYCADPGDMSIIPRTSILREFLGGGCFER